MLRFTDSQIGELNEVCSRYAVQALEVFGSAACDDFDYARSDVTFHPDTDLGPWLNGYFELKESLARILVRRVDLIESSSVRNPVLHEEIDASRYQLYAA